jgi:hypothetical protein
MQSNGKVVQAPLLIRVPSDNNYFVKSLPCTPASPNRRNYADYLATVIHRKFILKKKGKNVLLRMKSYVELNTITQFLWDAYLMLYICGILYPFFMDYGHTYTNVSTSMFDYLLPKIACMAAFVMRMESYPQDLLNIITISWKLSISTFFFSSVILLALYIHCITSDLTSSIRSVSLLEGKLSAKNKKQNYIISHNYFTSIQLDFLIFITIVYLLLQSIYVWILHILCVYTCRHNIVNIIVNRHSGPIDMILLSCFIVPLVIYLFFIVYVGICMMSFMKYLHLQIVK